MSSIFIHHPFYTHTHTEEIERKLQNDLKKVYARVASSSTFQCQRNSKSEKLTPTHSSPTKDETSDERRKKQRSVFHYICTSVHHWVVCECVCHCVSCFTSAFTSNVAVLPFRDVHHVQRIDHLGNLDWNQVEE